MLSITILYYTYPTLVSIHGISLGTLDGSRMATFGRNHFQIFFFFGGGLFLRLFLLRRPIRGLFEATNLGCWGTYLGFETPALAMCYNFFANGKMPTAVPKSCMFAPCKRVYYLWITQQRFLRIPCISKMIVQQSKVNKKSGIVIFRNISKRIYWLEEHSSNIFDNS